MGISDLRQFNHAMEFYELTRRRDVLIQIRIAIDKIEGVRESVLSKLASCPWHICLFCTNDAIKIILDTIERHQVDEACDLLFYVSKESRKRILQEVKLSAIFSIMKSIDEKNLTGVEIRQRVQWKKLYGLCKKILRMEKITYKDFLKNE